MYGRYGSDNLNRTLSGIVLVMIIADLFLKGYPRYIVWGLTLVLLCYVYFRMFSRKIYKRSRENQAFMRMINRIKNIRYYRYFKCPSCKTKIRVPKHKGKIEITCPKCRERFIKKT